MQRTSLNPEAAFLRDARLELRLTTTEAAQIVHASRRSWEGWENGSRPVPRAALDLFRSKLDGKAHSEGELVVMIANIDGRQDAIGVASIDNFVGLTHLSSSRFEVKTLAVDPFTKRPYVRRTELDISENKHVLKAMSKWKSVTE